MPLISNDEPITNVIYNGVEVTQIIYNGVSVWEQDGSPIYIPNPEPTGPTVGIYYAGNTSSSNTNRVNTVTRIDSNGALVGSETLVATAKVSLAGGGFIGNCGMYYGGLTSLLLNTVTRIDVDGALVGSETTAGTARMQLAGAGAGAVSIYYAGINTSTTEYNRVTRIDSAGALVGSETNVGSTRAQLGGASINTVGIYYGGSYEDAEFNYYILNFVTRIADTGTLIGSETSVGPLCDAPTGASIGDYGVYYGGWITGYSNTVTRIDASGALVGTSSGLGTARASMGGAKVGDYGIYYGGNNSTTVNNVVTRLNSLGTLVGSEVTLGTSRSWLAGASV